MLPYAEPQIWELRGLPRALCVLAFQRMSKQHLDMTTFLSFSPVTLTREHFPSFSQEKTSLEKIVLSLFWRVWEGQPSLLGTVLRYHHVDHL